MLAPCPYECDDPRCVNYSEPCTGGGGGSMPIPQIILQNFFSTYDTNILKSTDSLQVKAYMINKNVELINILCTNFPQTYKQNELNPEDEFITWAAIIHMIPEGEGKFSTVQQARLAIDWGCVRGVVLGFLIWQALLKIMQI